MASLDTITLDRNVRHRYYNVIVMPINVDGTGPAELDWGVTLTYEVWDQVCDTHGSFRYLLDAVQEAERLNELYDAK